MNLNGAHTYQFLLEDGTKKRVQGVAQLFPEAGLSFYGQPISVAIYKGESGPLYRVKFLGFAPSRALSHVKEFDGVEEVAEFWSEASMDKGALVSKIKIRFPCGDHDYPRMIKELDLGKVLIGGDLIRTHEAIRRLNERQNGQLITHPTTPLRPKGVSRLSEAEENAMH